MYLRIIIYSFRYTTIRARTTVPNPHELIHALDNFFGSRSAEFYSVGSIVCLSVLCLNFQTRLSSCCRVFLCRVKFQLNFICCIIFINDKLLQLLLFILTTKVHLCVCIRSVYVCIFFLSLSFHSMLNFVYRSQAAELSDGTFFCNV